LQWLVLSRLAYWELRETSKILENPRNPPIVQQISLTKSIPLVTTGGLTM
jgi:hypothetical protein